jgi:hypothetical protein
MDKEAASPKKKREQIPKLPMEVPEPSDFLGLAELRKEGLGFAFPFIDELKLLVHNEAMKKGGSTCPFEPTPAKDVEVGSVVYDNLCPSTTTLALSTAILAD